jgi:hypothetical protein
VSTEQDNSQPQPERRSLLKPAFIAAFTKTASITRAAEAAGCTRRLHYRWLHEDPEYAAEFAQARLEAGELIEDEAVRRAYEGIDETLVYQGGLCYSPDQYDEATGKLKPDAKPLTVKKYDSALLMKLMDGFLPEKYKKRGAVELSGPAGAPIEIKSNEQLKNLTDDELSALIAITSKLAAQ